LIKNNYICAMKNTILILIIAILILTILLQKKGVKEVVKTIEDTHKIDSLSNLNKLKQDSIDMLSKDINDLNGYNDLLKQDLNNNIAELKRIKNERRKKDSVISSSSVHQLESIFTERYNKGQ
jgi:predicted Holliday junction resolvase-like endonuclease